MQVQEITKNGEFIGRIFRRENKEGRLHNEQGPALFREEIGKNPYFEWWESGKLVATFDGETMKKSLDGNFSGLKEASMPIKWKNLESSLNLQDIALCHIKVEHTDLNMESVQSKIANIRKEQNNFKPVNSVKSNI